MNSKKTKGLSLVEVLVTIGILSIVTAAATGVIVTSLQTYATNRRIQTNQAHARMALLAMTRDAHQSNGLVGVDVTSGTSITIPIPSDAITMQTNTGVYLTYRIKDGVLRREESLPGWHIPFVGAEVESLTVSMRTYDHLTIEVLVAEDFQTKMTLSTTISLRRLANN